MIKKYTLITGASSGIGYEMAKIYAQKGENLILVARRKEILENLKNEYPNIEIIQMDLSIVENCNKIYEFTKSNNYFVNRLINNAGVGLFGEFVDTDINRELSMINLNIESLVVLTKLYLKDMKEKNEGEILNVASVAAFMPGPQMSIYYATKAFVSSFTRAIAYELRNSNIKVSILAPGATATEFVKSSDLESSKLFTNMRVMSAKQVANIAIKKLGKKGLIIPGLINKIGVFLARITPNCILVYMVNKIQDKK